MPVALYRQQYVGFCVFGEVFIQLGNLFGYQISEIIRDLDVFSVNRNAHDGSPFRAARSSGGAPDAWGAFTFFNYTIESQKQNEQFCELTKFCIFFQQYREKTGAPIFLSKRLKVTFCPVCDNCRCMGRSRSCRSRPFCAAYTICRRRTPSSPISRLQEYTRILGSYHFSFSRTVHL